LIVRNIQKSAGGSCCTLGNECNSHRASLASFFFRTFPGWYVSSPNWGAATTAIFNYF